MATRESILERFKADQDRLVLQASDLSLGALAEMVDSKTIDLDPSFQRRDRWSTEKQSALIESFLLNVPVPPVYLAEEEYGRYSVVDGRQRLSAIHSFLKTGLELQSLETITEVAGLSFARLPPEIQNALKIRPYLRVIILLRQTDPALKYEVFLRLNRGGEGMEPQEIRNVAFRGALNDLIYELAKNDFLRRQLKIEDKRSSAYRHMKDAEFVLRFFALSRTWRNFSGDLLAEMDKFMVDHRRVRDAEVSALRDKYQLAISAAEAIWGERAFQRPENDGWRDQALAGMFDAQMVAVSELAPQERTRAAHKRTHAIEQTRKLFNDKAFDQAVRQATNTPERVRYRITKVLDVLRSL